MASLRSIALSSVACILLFMVFGLGWTQAGDDNFSLRSSADSGVPDVVFYHGMVLDQDLQPIPPTLDNVSRLLRRFSQGLAGRASDTARLQFFDILQGVEARTEMDKSAEVLLHVALGRWLLQNNDFPMKDALDANLRALEAWATIPLRGGIDAQLRSNVDLAETLTALGIETWRTAPPEAGEPPATTPYIERCRSEQVPIPPDWGDPRWQFQYPFDQNYSFVNDVNSIAQVWVYVDPAVPGLCVGLPREDRDTGEIGLFGIICQSQTTGKACFWDNIDAQTGERLTDEESRRLKIAAVQDASNLGENCTNCHRGENVFQIPPRTSLDLTGKFVTETNVGWYTPISGQATWGNPGPIAGLTPGGCTRCHALPELANDNNTSTQSAYCRILRQVADKTMPKFGLPVGWYNPNDETEGYEKFAADIKLLRAKCELLPEEQN